MRKWIAVTAGLLLVGCASPTGKDPSVVVAPYHTLTVSFESLEEFLAQRPVIATGRVVAVNDRAYEVPVDPNAEGNTETDGPEIFGTISFKIETVLKGDIKPGSTLTIVYMSGKWNTKAKEDGRIAYTYERMAHLQKNDATLKTPAEHNDATFVIFAAPKPANDPVKADNLYRALTAPINGTGQVVFTEPPFESPAGAAVKLDEIKAAIG